MRKTFGIRILSPAAVLAAYALASCSVTPADMPDTGAAGRAVEVRLSGYGTSAGQEAPAAEDLQDIAGYLFEDGVFVSETGPFTKDGDLYRTEVDRKSGTLYIVAGPSGWPGAAAPGKGMTEDMWKETVVSSSGGKACTFFTGEAVLSSTGQAGAPVQTSLVRGVARFDMRIAVAGEALVHGITLENVIQDAYLLPSGEVRSPDNAGKADMVFSPQEPLDTDTEAVATVYEQDNPDLKVKLDATVDGERLTLGADLPDKIRRNTVYSITLRKGTSDAPVRLEVLEWSDGGTSDMVPDREAALAVDLSRSVIPDGVAVSKDRSALTLPHVQTGMTLAIDCDDELEIASVDGGSLLEITPLSGEGMNMFSVRKGLYAPGDKQASATVTFRRKGFSNVYPDDRITLELSANPTALEGRIGFGEGVYTYDFGTYADNEFGVFRLPEGKLLSIEFDEGEDEWMKAEEVPGEDGAYRILGGWRPNDPTADGRNQSARIVICGQDGSGREEYTVIRKNYGLPVVWMHGVWWCKYNSMGDSRSFGDQILSSDDPAAKAGLTLFEYLTSCSGEEYARLWGWAYQGDSGKGMRVVELDGKAVMEGFTTGSKVNINRLPADALSPDGYELPSMEEFNRIFDATDYVWVMWNGTHTLKTPWEGHSKVIREQRRKGGINVGTMTLSNIIYIAMRSPDFPDNEPLVWYGPGAQWNADGIQHAGHYNNMLFSVFSPEGSGWYIAGGMENLYLHKNGAGNNDTRILRFRKSDVEYIY